MLNDREKFIIATLVIKRSGNFRYTPEEKNRLLKLYVVLLPDVKDRKDLWVHMGKENEQYTQMIYKFQNNQTGDFNGLASSMTNREKYIYYNTEMMCTDNLPLPVHFCFKEIMKKILFNSENDLELLQELKEYTDVVLNWLRLMKNQKF